MEALTRKVAVMVLIITVISLTFISILSIWGIINPEAFYQSLTTMFVVGIGSLVVVSASKFFDEAPQNRKK